MTTASASRPRTATAPSTDRAAAVLAPQLQRVAAARGGLVLSRDALHGRIDRETLRQALSSGTLRRIAHGTYAATATWASLPPAARHRALVVAASESLSSVFSHQSAAAVHRIPRLDPWSDAVHVVRPAAGGGRSKKSIVRHDADPGEPPVQIDGVRVTTPGRTAFDLARTDSFASALVSMDHAMRVHGTTAGSFDDMLARARGRRGTARARRVVSLADPRSESPGESLCRARIIELGFQVPALQHEFYDAQGFVARGDMYWEEAALLLEFDGRVKYEDPAMLRGEDPRDVLWREKIREDRVRALGVRVIRALWRDIVWRDPHGPATLTRRLRNAGVPRA